MGRSGTDRRSSPAVPDPFALLSRVLTKVRTLWMKHTYPFAAFGSRVAIHYTCDLDRSMAPAIGFGDDIYVAKDVWLNVVPGADGDAPKMILGSGCKIGRRSTISSKNQIVLERDVLLAPSVLIMDHNHEFADPERPIHAQGVTAGGTIYIEANCWLGHGAVVVCDRGELRLGRNSVVGANAVVTRTFPPFSVVAGNPARLLKTLDPQSGRWVKAREMSKVND